MPSRVGVYVSLQNRAPDSKSPALQSKAPDPRFRSGFARSRDFGVSGFGYRVGLGFRPSLESDECRPRKHKRSRSRDRDAENEDFLL